MKSGCLMNSDSLQDSPARNRASPPAAIGTTLSLSAVSHQTGISVATLQVWQARYGLGSRLAADLLTHGRRAGSAPHRAARVAVAVAGARTDETTPVALIGRACEAL